MKNRRFGATKHTKRKAGTLIWDGSKGTYVKAIHGEIGTPKKKKK